MSKEVWRPVVPLREREREVVAIDLPGFGASPRGPRTLAGLVDAVAAFAAELGLERPNVAGNSLGGGIALALGASGRVRSACAVSPIGFAAGREPAYQRGVLATTRVVSQAIAPVAPMLARSRLARTALSAQRDRLLLFSRQAPRARRMLPAARHVVLHGCGHVPTWDDPEQVARVLLEASS